MKKTDQNYIGGAEDGTLSIFCVDSLEIKARVTFNSCVVDGMRLTYWLEETEDPQQVINDMFAILFEEVERINCEKQGAGDINNNLLE